LLGVSCYCTPASVHNNHRRRTMHPTNGIIRQRQTVESPRIHDCRQRASGMRDDELRLRYMAQSKMTRAGAAAPLPTLAEAQALFASASPERCAPQATRMARAAAAVRALFFGSST